MKVSVAEAAQNAMSLITARKLAVNSNRHMPSRADEKIRRIEDEFTERNITDFADLIRKHSSRFSITHLLRLLVVEKKARVLLAKEAIRKSWSVRELSSKLQSTRTSKHRNAGRKPFIIEDPTLLLVHLEKRIDGWVRWVVQNKEQFPIELGAEVKKAKSAMERLQKDVETRLNRNVAKAE